MGRWRLGMLQLPDPYAQVTGTVPMVDPIELQYGGVDTSHLKKTKKGIILHPQPGNNVNDPLNWSVWRRDLVLVIIGFHSLIGGGMTPILAAGFTTIAAEFQIDLTKLAFTVGGFMLALGVGSAVAAPFAVLYGKRIVYLVGVVIFVATSLWAAGSKSFASLLAARVVMGFGVCPVESLPSASIAEIYYHHERAYRLGIYTLLLLGGKNIVPLVSAFIINSLGWPWVFWIVAMIVGMNGILFFFFVPDTFFTRATVPDQRSVDETQRARLASARAISKEIINEEHRNSDDNGMERVDLAPTVVASQQQQVDKEKSIHDDVTFPEPSITRPNSLSLEPSLTIASIDIPKESYKEKMKLVKGRLDPLPYWKIFLRPFVLFCLPPVMFSAVIYALSVVWLIMLSESLSEAFHQEAYRFSSSSIGLLYISPFVGGMIGTLVAGRVSDFISQILVKRNNGIYEPEFRLIMIFPVFISVAIGLMGFGWSAEKQDFWIVPTIFFGIMSFGCSLGSTTAITYTVDCYRKYAAETLVTLNFLKNILGFIFSLFVNSFIQRRGFKVVFLAFGGIQIGCCLFVIPLYMFGKVIRHKIDELQPLRHL